MRTVKCLLFLLATFFVTHPLHAKAQNLGLDLAFGYNSNYGVLGIGTRYFLNDHLDIHAQIGGDLAGPLYGGGLRAYSGPLGPNCLFFIPCKPLVFAGLFFGHTSGNSAEVTEDGQESKFEIGSGDFISASVGSYDIFGEWFTTSLEIGYRQYYNSPTLTQVEGSQIESHREGLEELHDSGIFFSIGMGVLF